MIKIFIIDDSLMVRNAIYKVLKGAPDIEIIGEANNPVDAFEIFKKVGLPDLFILDIEMPKMDGLSFLKQINKQKPTPVIICSTLVTDGSNAAIDALALGASDIILKPKLNVKDFFDEYRDELIEKINVAVNSKVKYKSSIKAQTNMHKASEGQKPISKRFVAIGSSTGGVQVIEEIAMNLKENHQGIVITQHMPAGFTKSFAARLNATVANSIVLEAKDGDVIRDGVILIAPGAIHMLIKKVADKFVVELRDFERVNSHKPSVNVLFNSVCESAGSNATGFILTGMGDDGADGLKKMMLSGAKTYAQNEKTSTVFGMPRIALERGAAKEALSIFEITKMINSLE
ncbi:chemotaxis-specific protein-glutamate methyltransferase CheB [bacterium]|nr:chemotaxis-specific protein-glutamate methyltransferase CheB [bacterium]MBU1989891.1 chemotaxis-specific protein-glutamate methyltransferase CheB [bacterium]